MSVSNYRKKNQAEVTLSDGTAVQVRPLIASDLLTLGDVPNIFANPTTKGEPKAADPKFITGFIRLVLLNCIVGPKDFRIVDKRPIDCAESEISVTEITTEDTNKIVNEVSRISGLTPAAAEAAKPFPEEQAATR
jgi:hypothetical protein